MRADRLLTLLFLLGSRRRLTAEQVADALGVSERTVYRDMESLGLAGIPVVSLGGPGGGFFLDNSYELPAGLSADELRALFVPSGAGPAAALGWEPSIPLLKLLATLPSALRAEVDRMRQRFYLDPSPWFRRAESAALEPLQRAVWEDRVVTFLYRTGGDAARERRVEAYALVAKAQVWYLVAKAVGAPAKAMKTYRVSRIENLELADEAFLRDQDFRPDLYWTQARDAFEAAGRSSGLYTATLRVPSALAWYFPAYLEGLYRGAGVTEGRETFIVDFPDFEEARMRVLDLGGGVEIVEPAELRDAVRETARGILGGGDVEPQRLRKNPMERERE